MKSRLDILQQRIDDLEKKEKQQERDLSNNVFVKQDIEELDKLDTYNRNLQEDCQEITDQIERYNDMIKDLQHKVYSLQSEIIGRNQRGVQLHAIFENDQKKYKILKSLTGQMKFHKMSTSQSDMLTG